MLCFQLMELEPSGQKMQDKFTSFKLQLPGPKMISKDIGAREDCSNTDLKKVAVPDHL